MNAAALYPGVAVIEGTNVSVGRGTDSPFEQFGAPWMDGPKLAAALNARRLPGIRFYPTSFTPAASAFKGERCSGVFMIVTEREALQTARLGVEIASAIYREHGATLADRQDAAAARVGEGARRDQGARGPRADRRLVRERRRTVRLLRAKYLIYD